MCHDEMICGWGECEFSCVQKHRTLLIYWHLFASEMNGFLPMAYSYVAKRSKGYDVKR